MEEVLLRLHFLRYSKEREILLSPEDLSGVPDELWRHSGGRFKLWTQPVVSYNLDAEEIVQTLIEAGLSRDEIWPMVTITKTNLEKELRKLRIKELIDLALSTATTKVTERIKFNKQKVIE